MEDIMCEKDNKTKLADLVQFNEKAEADAITYYNQFLEEVMKSEAISKGEKEFIQAELYEIIGDELNHQNRLKTIYTIITGIPEAKD